MIDQTQASVRHRVLMVSVGLGGRALPVAWQVRRTSGAIGFPGQRDVLEAVRRLLPEGARRVLMGETASPPRSWPSRRRTIIHGSKLALHIWFWAVYLMATHFNGISAMQLWKQLGLGSYKSAWLLCAKLRRAMVDPERRMRRN